MAHRADPRSASSPSSRRRGRPPASPSQGGAPASMLLQPHEDPGPRTLMPHGARVTIREIPQPRRWHCPLRWYDFTTLALIAIALIALWKFR